MPAKRITLTLLVIIALVLSACKPAEPAAPTITQVDPQAVFTAAAATAQARLTQAAALPPAPSDTPLPSPTLAAQASLTPTASPSPVVSPIPAGADRVEFVLDVTVPDMTEFTAGAAFTKTWRLLNSGLTTWTTGYRVVFASGSQLGASTEVALPSEVPPGQTVDISIAMTAPSVNGVHTSFWLLRNPQNQTFGIGADGAQPFYVQINVIGADGAAAPSATPTGTAAGGAGVSNVTLAVDQASFEGDCPHTFNFTAQFTLGQAATVTYLLEAETGFEITLPAPTTSPLDAATHTVVYALEFSDDLNGWARFKVSSPENETSNQVSFTLNCK